MPTWSKRSRAASRRGRLPSPAARSLPCSVSAAIAEVGCAEACLTLLENEHAEIVPFSLDRIVQRFGHLAAIRDAILSRDDLPAPTRQALVVKLSETLADFVTAREWLAEERARRITREACEKATVTLAAASEDGEVRPLIRHLRESGQLTAGLMLRSLLSGNIELFEEALAELAAGAAQPRGRHRARPARRRLPRALRQGRPAGIDLSGVPRGAGGDARGGLHVRAGPAPRLKRRIIERTLTRCEERSAGRNRAAC